MLLLHATNTDKQTTNDTLRTFTLSFNCLQEHLLTPHVLHLRRSFQVCRFTQAALLQLKLTSAARPRAVLCATATTKMSVLRGSGLTSTKFRPLATTAISLLKVGQWHSRTWRFHFHVESWDETPSNLDFPSEKKRAHSFSGHSLRVSR